MEKALKDQLLAALAKSEYAFSDTMAFIDANFDFTPSAFQNGTAVNAANQNQGSCKVLSMGKLLDLSTGETLSCFGEFYQDVLNQPEGQDHQNIRQLMDKGLDQVTFEHFPLTLKSL